MNEIEKLVWRKQDRPRHQFIALPYLYTFTRFINRSVCSYGSSAKVNGKRFFFLIVSMLRLSHIIRQNYRFKLNIMEYTYKFGPSKITIIWMIQIRYAYNIIFHIICINLLIRPRIISGI